MAKGQPQYLAELQQVLDHAVRTGSWVVIVTPREAGCLEELRTLGLAYYPEGSRHVGRTALLPNDGRLTLTSLDSEILSEGFDLVFLGFDTTLKDKEVVLRNQWRDRARSVLSPGAEHGLLQSA